MSEDLAAVEQANASFYRALETLDLKAQATNVFVRMPEGWRMIVHHASPAPVRVTQPFSGTVQ